MGLFKLVGEMGSGRANQLLNDAAAGKVRLVTAEIVLANELTTHAKRKKQTDSPGS